MKPLLRDYLYFSKTQRRGLIILISIILFAGLALQFYSGNINTEADLNEAELDAYWAELQDQMMIREDSDEIIAEQKDGDLQLSLFPFDPNQIPLESWQELGLSVRQAKSILKYREKGGEFRKKSDLKKMYVVSEAIYQIWEPYIRISQTKHSKEGNDRTSKDENEFLLFDINQADSADLIRLKGIGPVYAARIVKYRNALGGFYAIDQLAEVWGLSDSSLTKLRPHLALNAPKLKMVRINHLSAEKLKDHPYISWKQANAIVNYRLQHGPFDGMNKLKHIYALDSSFFEQMLPYLEFE